VGGINDCSILSYQENLLVKQVSFEEEDEYNIVLRLEEKMVVVVEVIAVVP